MNEQTKTHIEHSAEIADLKKQNNELYCQYMERVNMNELLHKHIGQLGKQIMDLEIRMKVASDCHDLRINHIENRDVKIEQLESTINDVIQYLKIDSNSQYIDFQTRIYCSKIIELFNHQYHENTGTYLNDND
jgi:hypothetical protein